MTKEQIIDAVRNCAEKLGHVPSRNELTRDAQVSPKKIRWHFGTYTRLLRECNLEKRGGGTKLDMDSLLRDWAGMVRDLKKLPSLTEYEQFSKYSITPLITRFGVWAQVPYGIQQYIRDQGRTEEMKDVLEVIALQGRDVRPGRSLRTLRQGPDDVARAETLGLEDGPDNVISPGQHDAEGATNNEAGGTADGVYGSLLRFGPMVCAPTNEQGVLFLFGAMAETLGFAILKVGTAFPDCEAFRILPGDRVELVKVEIEFESRNFLKHLHDAKKCGLIVCWRHNWPECPLPVIELKKAISNQRSAFSQSKSKTLPLINTDDTDQERIG
ncbi:MAG TPA: hypothetical protein VGK21_10750 [Candidatus Angelobacter sp.]|jgi:hypothetical protein